MLYLILAYIQISFADSNVCPTPELAPVPRQIAEFKTLNSAQCILEQIDDPENCNCENQTSPMSLKAQEEALAVYNEIIEEIIEDEFIDSYRGRVYQMVEQSIALDVYLKQSELKEEDLIRVNACRPNAIFEEIKKLEADSDCSKQSFFKRRIAKLAKKESANQDLAGAKRREMEKKSVDEIASTVKDSFFAGIKSIAQNLPMNSNQCVPYKAYMEIMNGSRPFEKQWVRHSTAESHLKQFKSPLSGNISRLDYWNSEHQLFLDLIAKKMGAQAETQGGIVKGNSGANSRSPANEWTPEKIIDLKMSRENNSADTLSLSPLIAVIKSNAKLREQYESYIANKGLASEVKVDKPGTIISDKFMKDVLRVQNDSCKKMLDANLLRGMFCAPLPKPSKELYKSKILPKLYAKKKRYPSLNEALVSYYSKNYCPKASVGRPGAGRVKEEDQPDKIQIEDSLSPLTLEKGSLEKLNTLASDKTPYEKFNEKMCGILKGCESGECDDKASMAARISKDVMAKLSDPKAREELAKKLGVPVESLSESVEKIFLDYMSTRYDDLMGSEEQKRHADVLDSLAKVDREYRIELSNLSDFAARENEKSMPRKSIAVAMASCSAGEKCQSAEYWGAELGRRTISVLDDAQRAELASKLGVPVADVERAYMERLTKYYQLPTSERDKPENNIIALTQTSVNSKDPQLARTVLDMRGYLDSDMSKSPTPSESVSKLGFGDMLSPETDSSTGRTLFTDYAFNGTREHEVKMEEMKPVLEERDRNPIGVNTALEPPFSRAIPPVSLSPSTPPIAEPLPIGKTPTEEPVVVDKPISGSGKGASKSGGLTSVARESSSLSASKESVSTVAREEARPSVETTEKTPRDRKPDTSEKDSLNDAIARANKALEDYKKAQAGAGPNPEDDPEVKRLRGELDAARAAINDTRQALEDAKKTPTRGPASSIDNTLGNNYGWQGSGGTSRPIADPYDPVSSPVGTQPSVIDGAKSSETSQAQVASGGASGKSSSDSASVAPRGTMSPSQALQSLRQKGIVSDSSLLPFEFPNPISQTLLFHGYPNVNEERVIKMLSMLGLEGMNFKTIETIGEGASEHIVRFFGIDTVPLSGKFDPLRKCTRPMEDAKSRMRMYEDVKKMRAQAKTKFLAMLSKQICVTQEKRVGYDEYQRLVDSLLNQDRMLLRIQALAKERAIYLNRSPASGKE